MRIIPLLPLAAGLFAAALLGCASTEKSNETATASVGEFSEKPLSVEESIEVSVTANVRAIDHATRRLTLQDSSGHEVSFVVDRAVTRLHEVNVGDDVNARYRAVLLAELRGPTPDEAANPVTVVGITGRSPQGTSPAGGVAQATRIVTTVEAVDVPNMRVTLRGPMNDLAVVRGKRQENVKKLRIGDTIVITFTESLVISLEKVASN